jgi:hypothetical protein
MPTPEERAGEIYRKWFGEPPDPDDLSLIYGWIVKGLREAQLEAWKKGYKQAFETAKELREKAVAEEREACALVVWDAEPPTTDGTFNLLDVRAAMAKAIRARNEETKCSSG